jgi:hypothetical protein
MTDSQDPWYAGSSGWTQLSKAFQRLELVKPDPDYRSLVEQVAFYPAEERHAVWVEVAQSATSRAARTRAYVEALHNDPDPASVAWGWLDGDFDLMEKVEHVIDPADPRTLATVERVRERLGSIIEAGGRDLPVVTETAASEQSAVAAAETPTETAAPMSMPERPAPAPMPAQPAPQSPAAPMWSPTHFVPMGGLPAWDYPDPNRPPIAALNARLGLVVEAVAGDWALVRAVNGWRGWVDGRRLTGPA